MSTTGATSLNRILRITANLLFEKGQQPSDVAGLMAGFVTPAMIRTWHQRFQETHGLQTADTSPRQVRRLPMPPIDFRAIELEAMESLLEPLPDEEGDVEPEW